MASVWFRQRALKGPLTPFQDRVKILPIIVGFGDALVTSHAIEARSISIHARLTKLRPCTTTRRR